MLVKPYNNNTLQEDKERLRMNLLIATSISSTDLLLGSEFWKIHPLVVNLFPEKIKQLPKAGRAKHFVKNWQKLTNNPMVLAIVRRYKIPFILSSRQLFCRRGKATKFVSINQRSVRPSGSGGPGHVEEGCYSSYGSQGGPISYLVSCEKERWDNRLIVNLRDLNSNVLYQYFKIVRIVRIVTIKGNAVTMGQNVQDRPEDGPSPIITS